MIIKSALISVSDVSGLVDFAKYLYDNNVEIIATTGTAAYLKEHGISTTAVEDITGFREILGGRVKTLHPKIFGGILADSTQEEHITDRKLLNITKIDLVCVNLYPFENVIKKENIKLEQAVENIDIGGSALIRAAAKNFQEVVVVTDPSDYSMVIDALSNVTIDKHRCKLAAKAFMQSAYYDSLIANYLNNDKQVFNEHHVVPLKRFSFLRYGENMHQKAVCYSFGDINSNVLANSQQLQGKQLSYNNLLDADAALQCVQQFVDPACVIVKHTNPCGVATAQTPVEAFKLSLMGDRISSFGGVIAFNRRIDIHVALLLVKNFVEVLIAPDFSDEALNILIDKSNLRILKIDNNYINSYSYRTIHGGLLLQESDTHKLDIDNLKLVTTVKISKEDYKDLLFAWNVVRYVKSNAIVLVKNCCTVGIGAGQMSRVDACKIAVDKAHHTEFQLSGLVCASDAFFPFRDGIDALAKAGVTVIIQPGGSINDKEAIDAANDLGIAMVFTGVRAFCH